MSWLLSMENKEKHRKQKQIIHSNRECNTMSWILQMERKRIEKERKKEFIQSKKSIRMSSSSPSEDNKLCRQPYLRNINEDNIQDVVRAGDGFCSTCYQVYPKMDDKKR